MERKRRLLKSETENQSVTVEVISKKQTLAKFAEQYIRPRQIKGETAHVGASIEVKLSGGFQTTAIVVEATIPVEASEEELILGQDYLLELLNRGIDERLASLERYIERLLPMRGRLEKQ